MLCATARASWIATGLMPGSGAAAPSGLKDAMSPMTNSSGWPGTAQSGPTITRPPPSRGTPSAAARGLGRTPAPQSTVPAWSVSPPTFTPPASIDSTRTPVRTSTPSSSSCARARADSGGSNGVRIRSAISTNTTRTALRSRRRKSTARMSRDRSAIAPASSTPVGPPPTTTNVSWRWRSTGSVARSAASSAVSTRPRTSSASSRSFSPGANLAHSSCPK